MRETLEEKVGMVWTNGKDIFGRVIYLGDSLKKEDFHQITLEEYEAIIAAEEEAAMEVNA